MCDRCFTKYAWVKSLKYEKAKTVLMDLLKSLTNLIVSQIKYVLIKEENFKIAICKND